jgi:hypothetical protein
MSDEFLEDGAHGVVVETTRAQIDVGLSWLQRQDPLQLEAAAGCGSPVGYAR